MSRIHLYYMCDPFILWWLSRIMVGCKLCVCDHMDTIELRRPLNTISIGQKVHCQPFDVCLFPLYECVCVCCMRWLSAFTSNILCALYVTVTTVLCVSVSHIVCVYAMGMLCAGSRTSADWFDLLSTLYILYGWHWLYAVHCTSTTGDRTVSYRLVLSHC